MTPTDPVTPPPAAPAPDRPKGWWLPYAVLAVVGLYLAAAAARSGPPKQPFDLDAFARLPVVDGGRVKPLETVARVYLRLISEKETYTETPGGKDQPAIKWYLDLVSAGVTDQEGAFKYRIIRIDNEQLLNDLKLPVREGFRYSIDEISDSLNDPNKLPKWAAAAHRRKQAKQPLDQREVKVLELAERIEMLGKLRNQEVPLVLPPQAGRPWESYGTLRAAAVPMADIEAAVMRQHGFPEHVSFRVLVTTPPPEGLEDQHRELVATIRREIRAERDRRTAKLLEADAEAAAFLAICKAYRANDPETFNKLVTEYRDRFYDEVPAKDITRTRVEVTYDRLAPFYYCTALYVMVFVCCALSWMGWSKSLRSSAFVLLAMTVFLHTAALLTRMYVLDRWGVFVTNLYSSAIFIGWGSVLLGLGLEFLFKNGVGNLVAAVLGTATTILSHNLAAGGDTMEMMQAVLDTNFWLATHVTTITLGYTATLVAGFIGIAYVARMLATVVRDGFTAPGAPTNGSLFAFSLAVCGLVAIPGMLLWAGLNAAHEYEAVPTALYQLLSLVLAAAAVVYAMALIALRVMNPGVDAHGAPVPGQLPPLGRPLAGLALTAEDGRKLSQMIYGVICFATLLSFVGTVLGGIWADQSWGRFWGWDPKENGAVLIVLWNALILHARWAGMVKARGVAVLAVVGNMITVWSWFGTNQLGVGLHAYGFSDKLARGCANFWLSQLVIIGVGLIPARYWASAVRRTATGPATAAVTDTPAPVAATTNGQAPPPRAGRKKHKRR